MEQAFKRGERVKHKTMPEWGLGEILNDQAGENVQVIFENAGLRTFKVGIAPFIRVTGEESESVYLTGLVKRHGKGQAHGWSSAPVVPFPRAVEDFLRHFPDGFQDSLYLREERDYKVKASEFLLDSLSRDNMQRLMEAGEHGKICTLARKVMNQTNLISHHEKISLSNALDSPGRQQLFAEALNRLLYSGEPPQQRFEAFATMLKAVGAAKWPVASYFLFMRFPADHMFLKPEVTKYCADVAKHDLKYVPAPNWLTYSRTLGLAANVKSKLAQHRNEALVARDMIDVYSFIWVIGAYD